MMGGSQLGGERVGTWVTLICMKHRQLKAHTMRMLVLVVVPHAGASMQRSTWTCAHGGAQAEGQRHTHMAVLMGIYTCMHTWHTLMAHTPQAHVAGVYLGIC